MARYLRVLLLFLVLAGCAQAPTTARRSSADEPDNLAASSVPQDMIAFLDAIVDPAGGAGEPSLAIAGQRIVVAAPLGSATARAEAVWVSDDGGASFADLGRPTYPFGGGDSDVILREDGTIHLTGMWSPAISTRSTPASGLPGPAFPTPWCVSVATTEDDGATWIINPVACDVPGLLDRQWIAYGGGDTLFLVYVSFPSGMMFARSDDGGKTFPQLTRIPGTGSSLGPLRPFPGEPGSGGKPVVVDDHTIHIPYVSESGVWLITTTDAGLTFQMRPIAKSAVAQDGFASLARLPSGALVMTWADVERGSRVIVVTMSTDDGETWTVPTRVDADASSIMPWVAASPRGRVGIAWYATDHAGDPNTLADASWRVHAAFLDDNLTVIARADVSGREVHRGGICTFGGQCDPKDRRLLDFLQTAFAPDDRFFVAAADDSAGPDKPVIDHIYRESPAKASQPGSARDPRSAPANAYPRPASWTSDP